MARRSLKAAPRRPILDVERHGDWGDVTYLHHLACGHTETRKRRSPADVLACSGCLTAAEFAAGVLPSTPPPPPRLPVDAPYLDEDAALETEGARVRAALANRFGVEPDAVDVVLRADSGIAYVLVFLERDVAARLARLDSDKDV